MSPLMIIGGGLIPESITNKLIGWENTRSLDVGFELKIFDRFYVDFNYFSQKKTDMLANYQRPSSIAGGGNISNFSANVGDMTTHGIEIEAIIDVIKTDNILFRIAPNIHNFKSTIDVLSPTYVNGKLDVIHFIQGGTPNDIYVGKYAGYDPDTGEPYYYKRESITDAEGNVTEVLSKTKDFFTEASLFNVGSSTPDFEGGLRSHFSYKNFEISCNMSFVIGGKTLDRNYSNLLGSFALPYNHHKDFTNRWRKPGDTEPFYPRADFFQSITENTDLGIIGRDYFAINNIRLRYELHGTILKKLKVFKKIALDVSVSNIYIKTEVKGFNPNMVRGFNPGFNNGGGGYPQYRSYNFGLSFSL